MKIKLKMSTVPDFEIQIDNYKYIKDVYYETFDVYIYLLLLWSIKLKI